MSTTELKAFIHQKIDTSENELLLQHVKELLEDDGEYELVANPVITQLLEERREEYVKDNNSTIALAEWQQKMKDKYGFQS